VAKVMKKVLLLLLLVSLSVSAQTQTSDPVASLREQIQAASTAAERNRLTLKLADLLVKSGHRSDAVAELQQMAGSSDFDPIGFYNLGNFFARLGEPDAAIAAYRNAINQRNGQYSRAYNNLGVVLLRAGRWDEAQDALLSALKLENFRYAEASYNLGRVYAARGQKDLAVREWRRALAVDPRHDAAAQALANALVNVGNEDRIVVKSPSAKAPRNVESKKSAPAAVPSSEAIPLTLDQSSFDFLQRARSASERGKMLEAVENYRRVLNREGGYFAPANLELSFALLSLKRQDEALANLLQVSQRDGARYPISYFHLGRIYESKGELKLAEAAFSKAASTYQPTNPQFLLDLSRVREKLSDFKGALDAMEQYLKLLQADGQKPVWCDSRIAELRSKAQPN
jgi:tetratricopeptide (TPR) repeat protein